MLSDSNEPRANRVKRVRTHRARPDTDSLRAVALARLNHTVSFFISEPGCLIAYCSRCSKSGSFKITLNCYMCSESLTRATSRLASCLISCEKL